MFFNLPVSIALNLYIIIAGSRYLFDEFLPIFRTVSLHVVP